MKTNSAICVAALFAGFCNSTAQAAAGSNQMEWFSNLTNTYNGKAFCAPPKTSMIDLLQVVSDYSKAHPEWRGQVTDRQTIEALTDRYPCTTTHSANDTAELQTKGLEPNTVETLTTPDAVFGSKRMLDYIGHNSMKILAELGRQQDKTLGLQQSCTSNSKIEVVNVGMLQAIELRTNKVHPSKGVWRLGYELQRCGETKRYNTFFSASAAGDEAPKATQYYPGSTLAGPTLVHDAMRSALVTATGQGKVAKDCKDIFVQDMQVLEQPHDVIEGAESFKRVWREQWSFNLCGQTSQVELTFIPDKTGGGTSFSAKANPSTVAKSETTVRQ